MSSDGIDFWKEIWAYHWFFYNSTDIFVNWQVLGCYLTKEVNVFLWFYISVIELNTEVFLHVLFDANMIASHLSELGVNLFSISQLFADACSIDKFASNAFGSLCETNSLLSSAYRISLQFNAISMSFEWHVAYSNGPGRLPYETSFTTGWAGVINRSSAKSLTVGCKMFFNLNVQYIFQYFRNCT